MMLNSQWYEEEATFLKKTCDWLDALKPYGIKRMRICDRYAKGYSDVFICVRGMFVVAELKDDEGVATPHQKQFIAEIIAAGGIGGECKSLKDVAYLLHYAIHKYEVQ